MAKLSVKLRHQHARFKDDSGRQLEAHKTYQLEGTERILKAIKIGVLEKQVKNGTEPELLKEPEGHETPPSPPADAEKKK